MPKPYFTLAYQFGLAETALKEAQNLLKAKYYTSSISNSFQVVHRCAAGLLFGADSSVHTEREVGIGFESAFVSSGRSAPEYGQIYRKLAKMRQRSDFEFEYVATREEAEDALGLAQRFHQEAHRLKALLA